MTSFGGKKNLQKVHVNGNVLRTWPGNYMGKTTPVWQLTLSPTLPSNVM